MKNITSTITILALCLGMVACNSPKVSESDTSTKNNIQSDTVSDTMSYVDIYQEAQKFLENGERLKAMQLFMTIYDYQDAYEKYNSLLLRNRITIGHWVGFVDDDSHVTVIGDDESKDIRKEVANWEDITAISSHYNGVVGLKKNGMVVSTPDTEKTKWYSGAEVVDSWTDIKQISSGGYHTVGLKSGGTVIATKYVGDISKNKGQCNISSWLDIVYVAAGSTHTVGLKKDGTVVAVGNNENGQCSVGSWKDIVSISAHSDSTLGLTKDGTVLCTNSSIDTSNWTDIVYASVGYAHAIGFKNDGTVIATGSNNNKECETQNWSNIMYADAGSSTTAGISNDGTIVLIGNESYKCFDVNGYNIFSGEKGTPIKQKLDIPSSFPDNIPLYNMKEIIKISDNFDATIVTFETASSIDEVFAYYEKWCSDKGGYLKQPYQENIDMLITPLNNIKKALTIIVSKGATLEDGTTTKNPVVILMLQGGATYKLVENLK